MCILIEFLKINYLNVGVFGAKCIKSFDRQWNNILLIYKLKFISNKCLILPSMYPFMYVSKGIYGFFNTCELIYRLF